MKIGRFSSVNRRGLLVLLGISLSAHLAVGSASGVRSIARGSCGRTSVVLARLRAEPDPLRAFPPETALVVRCGTFPIKLYRHGRLVVSGSCFVHAFQYRDYYFIESRLNRTWMLLPAGTWIIEDLLQEQDQGGSGAPMRQSARVLRSQGRITAFSTQLSGNGVPYVPSKARPRIPARIACGVSADHPAPPPNLRVPIVTSYTIISWPAFNVVASGKRELPW